MHADWADLVARIRSVRALYDGRPARSFFGGPASRESIDRVQSKVGVIPPEYAQVLVHFDGAHIWPWNDAGDGGIALLSVCDLERWNGYAYSPMDDADPGPGRRPFFIVGQIPGTGDYLGMRPDGAVYYLDHEYGMVEWIQGRGLVRLASSLRELVERYVAEGGRMWWMEGEG